MLRCEDLGGVRRLTLDRPEKLNALSSALVEALTQALEAAARAEAVRAVVLAGTGRAFCAGADVTELASTPDAAAVRAHAARSARLHDTLARFGKPTVAAVQGLALGGGCGLALACDMVVCGESAQFGYPEITRGIVPAIVLPNLVRQVGWKAAFELAATGARIDAARAAALGLVNHVVADEAVGEEAVRLASELADRDPAAMRWLKRVFVETREGSLGEALARARDANAESRIERLPPTRR